jgi:DNA-binding NarL/FixJ family response regulator
MNLKVLIYEDNEDLRSSVVSLLQWANEYTVVGAMPDAVEIDKDLETFLPDVILMDIDMPNSNGVTAVSKIRTIDENIPIIMFTVFDDDDNIFNAICAGANGYILKKDINELPAAIADVMNGGAPMNSAIARKVITILSKQKPIKNNNLELLTSREYEIVGFMSKGYSYKMIAAELEIATETVRTHIKRVYKKLQVNNVSGALSKLKL